MTPLIDPPVGNRRTVLKSIGAAVGAGALEGAFGAAAQDAGTVVLEQGDRCVELPVLRGEEPVEELYDYAYPTDRYEGPPGSDGMSYSSEGTTDLQRDRTSALFLYEGSEGTSLVLVHGHLEGEDDAGGTMTFEIEGVPEGASWIVRDDYYLQDGEPAPSNDDRWDVEGETHVVDWAYQAGRTDGGALRGLGSEFRLTIEPAFNDDAALAEGRDYGPVESWEALGGDRDDPERIALEMDRPLTIRTGTCGDSGDEDGEEDDDHRDESEEDEEPEERDDDRHEDEADDDDDYDDDDDDHDDGDDYDDDDYDDDDDDDDEEEREEEREREKEREREEEREEEDDDDWDDDGPGRGGPPGDEHPGRGNPPDHARGNGNPPGHARGNGKKRGHRD